MSLSPYVCLSPSVCMPVSLCLSPLVGLSLSLSLAAPEAESDHVHNMTLYSSVFDISQCCITVRVLHCEINLKDSREKFCRAKISEENPD